MTEDHKPDINGDSSNKRGLEGDMDESRKKRARRKAMGRACVYCRRSHMVCEGGRPCERCVRREIAHLCRDVTPPPNVRRQSDHSGKETISPSNPPEPIIHPPPATLPPVQPQQQQQQPLQIQQPIQTTSAQSRLPTSLYSDPNFPPSWPLLPDTEGPVTYGDGSGNNGGQNGMNGNWGQGDNSELGALTKFLGDLGVPSLPGGFLDVLSYFSRDGQGNTQGNNLAGVQLPGVSNASSQDQTRDPSPLPPIPDANSGPASRSEYSNGGTSGGGGKGKAKEVAFAPPQLTGVSRIERYFLAAADQPSGPRASRLAQVIKAKYDAGLLKPYDYVKGYERMNKWMDSGRAAPKADSIQGSAPSSPQKGSFSFGRARLTSATPTSTYGASISPESRRRILTALNGFRPKFRQIARTLTDVDLVFVEEAMERWMLEYDRAFASIHTPSCIWRRTGEIQKANQEFANLTGIPASMFRNGILCVYELMDEDSAVRYWEGYAKIAFDAGQRSLTTHCTLKVPMSLTRSRLGRNATPASIGGRATTLAGAPPDLALPQAMINSSLPMARGNSGSMTPDPQMVREEYREIKCCFSVTIRRDAWGVPVAIMGQWIPI